jgi:hypothetical protein
VARPTDCPNLTEGDIRAVEREPGFGREWLFQSSPIALHRRGIVTAATLYAFDLLELEGQDLRDMPLGERKKRLRRLVGKRRLRHRAEPAH